MISNKNGRHLARLLLAFLVALAAAAPARAIVINDTAGAAMAVTLGEPHTAVVELFVPAGFCTGTLIDATHILTAQHCTFGASPGSMSVHFQLDGGASASYGVVAKAEPDGVNNYVDGTDIAIITLDAPAPIGVTPVPLAVSNPVGQVAQAVGFGFAGVGSSGAGGGNGVRRAIENVIDAYGAALNQPGTSSSVGNIFNTDFDDGTVGNNTLSGAGSTPVPLTYEGTTAGGDSGGPLLVDGRIVGVLSGGTTANSVYGDISWWTGTFDYASFIQANAPGAVFGTGAPADTPSNASFSSSLDEDVLNIDFGFVHYQSAVADVDFDITNLPIGPTVAPLDLLSVTGSGDTGALTTDVAPFVDLLPGFTSSFSASLDSSSLGNQAATYSVNFTDELGTNQTLTINMTADVSTDDPTIPDLVYDAVTGDVYLDPRDAGSMIGYVLKSGGTFLPGNFSPFLGGVATSTTSEISEASLTSYTSPVGIGAILPAGMTLDDLYNTLTTRNVSPALGAPVVALDIVMACLAGDADCDGDIDIGGDIFKAFSNFTGPGSFGMTRADGDVDTHPFGDGDVDVSDLLVMFGHFTGPLDEGGQLAPAEAADPGVPDLIYNPVTGEVILDVDGAGIIGYVLKNGDGTFTAGNHTTILGGVSTSLGGELSEAAFASSVGATSIGLVFPTGMDLAALSAYLTTNEVSTSLGAPVVPFDLVISPAAVPEPSAIIMGAMSLLGAVFVWWRRRGKVKAEVDQPEGI